MEAKAVKYASTRFGIVKRSKGQSAIDHVSYISRSVIVSEYDGQTYRPKYHGFSALRGESDRKDRGIRTNDHRRGESPENTDFL